MSTRSPSPPGGTSGKLRLPSACNPPGENNPARQAVWIIFGATGHIGRSLVRTALSHGDKVTAVGRTFEHSIERMRGWHENCLGLLCDVRARDTVNAVIQESIKHWGRVDIIANCTGYGVVGAAEDQSEHELHDQFNTNFLGTLHILQLSLPYFRINNIPGRYLIFSSTSGALGVPGLAPYCATKYAVEGLIESMLYETDCFGIKATLVEPGYMRLDDTDDTLAAAEPTFLDQTQVHYGENHPPQPQPRPPIDPQITGPSAGRAPALPKRYGHFSIKPLSPNSPYNSPTSPAGHAKRVFQWLNMRQPTSAVRSAELVWQLGHCMYPPLRLLLGTYAVESIRDRLRSVIEEIEDWKFLSFPTDGEGGGEDGDGNGEGEDGEDGRDEDGEEGEGEEEGMDVDA